MKSANTEPDGSHGRPFTSLPADPTSNQYKHCKCCACGTIAVCTPEFDFYAGGQGQPFKCERCYFGGLKAQGMKKVDLT